jgi:glucuronate isomerase
VKARPKIHLPEDRYFDPNPRQKEIALHLYGMVKGLPLICPHSHVDPRMFADPDYSFGTPTKLILVPDHYIFRMLYSQGIPLERLGIPRRDGGPVEQDPRRAWQIFADSFHLFRGTPTGMWLAHEFREVFGIEDKLTSESAQDIYDQIAACLERPEFRPRRLFERFNIEVMATTDAASDPLTHHRAIRESGWGGRIIPTFRPDAVTNLMAPGWRRSIDALSQASGIDVNGYPAFIRALEDRRAFFRDMGATATDHGAITAYTAELSPRDAEVIFGRALAGEATEKDAARFTGHMLM